MASPTDVDLLVFGPHPDDIEIGLAGPSRSTRRSAFASACAI